MKEKIFGVLQRVGRSFMLPIAVLPIAGILLGVGGSFTNQTLLETYHLMGILGPGTVLNDIFTVLNNCGGIIFDNLPLIFAIGVAIGMAKAEKEVAALSAAIAFLVMHAGIGAMITLNGGVGAMLSNSTATVLGITSLSMGAFGGIIVGLGVAALHNKFYKIQLPQILSFFGGTRFVPIISVLVYALVGLAMFYVWQPVQTGINALGMAMQSAGYGGTFLFGMIKRLLIPFGLHHVFYMPFWQTGLGGTMEVAGQMISGAQNIFFAQLSDPAVTHFSTQGTWCFTGEFVIYIFGFPGAALAMYRNAKPEKRKVAGGLLLSAALTSILTGITEPLEFSFLFVAPVLFGISTILAGAAYMLCQMLNITVGLTFSGGLIDLFMFGILQGNAKTSWLLILPLGIVYFFLYYFIFSFLIKKLNLKTPGREDEDEDTKLYTKADYQEKKADRKSGIDRQSAAISLGLGGYANIVDVDCCATRLRVTVTDGTLVKEGALKNTGASGVIRKGNGVQVIYGPQVNIIKSHLEEYLNSGSAAKSEAAGSTAELEQTEETSKVPKVDGALVKTVMISSPVKGIIKSVTESPDEAFSSKMLGDGVTMEPVEGVVYAPADGTVNLIFETKHAIGFTTDSGIEMLIHVGIDTVKMKGQGFEIFVNAGAKVNKGDKLLTFDMDFLREKVPSLSSACICTELGEHQKLRLIKEGMVNEGEEILAIDFYKV